MWKGKSNFHVVFYGRRPGIYNSWVECRDQVSGYSGNAHTAYATLAEAETAWAAFCKQHQPEAAENSSPQGGFSGVRTSQTGSSGTPGHSTGGESARSEFLLSFSMEEWVCQACYALGIEQPTFAVAETRVINGSECVKYHAWLTTKLNGETATATGSFASTATHAREDVACSLLSRMVQITGLAIKDFNQHKVHDLEDQIFRLPYWKLKSTP